MSCSKCKDIHSAQLTGRSNLECLCKCHNIAIKKHPDVPPYWHDRAIQKGHKII